MWSTLVTADDLRAKLREPNLVVLDVRHRLAEPDWGAAQWANGHIPGSVHAHIDRDLSSKPMPTTGRHPLPDPDALRVTFSKWGIDDATQVVAYDDQGGIWAARAWWLLKDYGHEAVAVLDGGFTKWVQGSGAVTRAPANKPPRTFSGTPGHRPQMKASEILRRIQTDPPRLLDARAPERFRGDMELVDPVAGHIPTARSLPALSLLAEDQRFLPKDELRHRLATALGSKTPRDTIAYCGSGVTGSHLVLAYEAAGIGSIALYPGSWSEWIRDPKRPVAKGPDDATGRA